MNSTGILLVNLGSPDSHDVPDVRVYLREFLMDKNVIDAPYIIRKMVVEGIILPFRPKESAEAYESIWWEEGSPLIVISRRQMEKLKSRLGPDVPIALGMRYGNPSIKAGIEDLKRQNPNLERIFLIPMYPQYAMATTLTVIEKTEEVLKEMNSSLKLDVMPPYYNHPKYVTALAESIKPYLTEDIDHLLFSYHGVPVRHLKKTDPTKSHCYKCENCCEVASEAHAVCYKHQDLETTKHVMAQIDWPAEKFSNSFQSRLGIDPWLEPATDKTLVKLGKSGVKRVAVACPAFVADCIETLEEIAIRGEEDFIEAGGEKLTVIPCINDNDLFIDALEQFCKEALEAEVTT